MICITLKLFSKIRFTDALKYLNSENFLRIFEKKLNWGIWSLSRAEAFLLKYKRTRALFVKSLQSTSRLVSNEMLQYFL